MILTTTNNIENFKIADYLGIVTGTAYDSSYTANGTKMSFKDMFSMTKYYEKYSLALESIKEKAFQNLKDTLKGFDQIILKHIETPLIKYK